MGFFEQIGRVSDRLTSRLLKNHTARAAADLVCERRGFVRKAQLSAIMATSIPMMAANICNVLAVVTLQFYVARLDAVTLLWAALVTAFAFLGIASASRFRKAPTRAVASLRAPGKIVASSVILASIWCFPLLYLLPGGDLLQVAFISALTAGMIAGGALALYPVPLAGFVYVAILSAMAFFTILVTGLLPLLPFGLVIGSFALIVVFSARRHTILFLSELIGRLEAERQRDMVNLLLDTYQGTGGQYLWRSDRHLTLTAAPRSLFHMVGLDDEEAASANLIDLLGAADAVGYNAESATAYDAMRAANGLTDSDFEMILRIRNGHFLKVAGRREFDGKTKRPSYHGYLKDVTPEIQAIENVYRLATCDTMTGLLNYREFGIRAKADLQARRAQDGEVVFVFLDADNLKKVNDSFGHAVGDRLIETIAERLEQLLPKDSLIARKGGDEFVALVPLEHGVDLADWATALMDSASVCYRCDGLELPVSCCVGVSRSPYATADLPTLELEADRALYIAKSQGKRQARVYKERFGQELQRDRVLALDLAAAIEQGDLKLLFQPIVDLKTSAVLGAEALLRWEHPVYNDVPPQKIVSIAQTEGLGPRLFEYVLFRAVTRAKNWTNGAFVSVNMHSADLQIVNFDMRICEILEGVGFPPDRLWLEITETELLKDAGPVKENLDRLRALGVWIAIDDFGTGYSSLSYLTTYPSDVIKIDKSLTSDCSLNDSNMIIVQTIKTLAAVSGFKVVAEGVEHQSDTEILRQLGIEMAQGFGFHKPMLPVDIDRLLLQTSLVQQPSVA